jgi:hypothetical protein
VTFFPTPPSQQKGDGGVGKKITAIKVREKRSTKKVKGKKK